MVNAASSSVRVRSANANDLDALVELSVGIQQLHATGRPDLFRAPERASLRDFLRSRLDDTSIVLVAVDDGRAVGYVLAEELRRPVSPFRHPSHSLYVHHIAVAPYSQRTGVGKLLLDEISTYASSMGADAVRLDSWAFNDDAHDFFRTQGFVASNIVFERPLSAPTSSADR
ncbi:ribosomal protein S18 acetylase RimI-like enzyme [Microterricola gilva]|uniref:Ribosomal protein S18 acetylase RimI-like enzyme n=1 Tax=Microterricola gilva TaxID=393267 RepID=A0A4Q8AMB9_9MICO|nr:GNAT family N-acetyltransferase [Microterricola gilva]RZU65241.1 ribosomal protein S18 acetylase RimI-like enzyme [Microterricola gilva]